jgi:hypothetical protein
MPNQDINIKITLTDQVTKNLQKVSGSMRDFGRQMKETGRNLSQVGMYMTTLGAGITAPLILAYKTAGKFNAEIGHQIRETQNVFNNLSVSIGKSLLPVMRQLTDTVAKAVDWWKNLEQATRDKIIQNFMKLGVTITSIGIALVVVGNALKLLANLAVLSATLMAMNPVVLAVGVSFTILAVAMWKCKVIGDIVIDTLQRIPRAVAWLMGMPKMDVEAILGKQGDWKNKFNEFKDMFADFGKTWTDLSNSISKQSGGGDSKKSVGGFWSGFEVATTEAMDKLRDFQQLGYDVANQLTTDLASAFSSFINDAFSGQLKKAQDYFAMFGKSILNMFSQVISKMIAEWLAFQAVMAGRQLVGNILGLLSSASGGRNWGGGKGVPSTPRSSSGAMWRPVTMHTGGLIRAHSGLNVGEVPIIAQSGERVLSRGQNREYEKGGKQQPTVVVIQAWDTQDIMRNRKSIEGIIMNALKSNSGMRGAVKSYG